MPPRMGDGDARDQQLTELQIAKKNLRLLIGPILAESAARENKPSLTGYSHLEAIASRTDESATSRGCYFACGFSQLSFYKHRALRT